MVETVILQVGADVQVHVLVVAVEVLIGSKPQVLVAEAAEAMVVGVARRQVVLSHGARLALRVLVVDGGIGMKLPPLVAVADVEAPASALAIHPIMYSFFNRTSMT